MCWRVAAILGTVARGLVASCPVVATAVDGGERGSWMDTRKPDKGPVRRPLDGAPEAIRGEAGARAALRRRRRRRADEAGLQGLVRMLARQMPARDAR
jgi:hypothetical protein